MKRLVLAIVLVCITSSANAGLVCYSYTYAPNLVRAVQEVLKKHHLYAGVINGYWGQKTKDAVRKFQVRNHIDVQWGNEGELEPQTLRAMFGDNTLTGDITRIPNPDHAPSDIWSKVCQ